MTAGGCKVSHGDEKEWEGVHTAEQAMMGMWCYDSATMLALAKSSSATHRLGLHFLSMPTCCSMETVQTAFRGGEMAQSAKCLQTQGLEFDSPKPM